jgi:PEP-CTERM motif
MGLVLFAGGAMGSSAFAQVTLLDNYVGGVDHGYGDVIGDSSFQITSATVERFGTGASSYLQVIINTNFAGQSGVEAGTGYGALFISNNSPTAWQPVGGTAANGYLTDTASSNLTDWEYAVTPTNTGLYNTANGTFVLSNVYGGTTSNTGAASGFIFRDDQYVNFTPNAPAVDPASFTVGTGELTFIINDGGLLGNDFAISWAETCANDIIQGQVTAVPEPSTWAMMLIGFAVVGFTSYRRSRKICGINSVVEECV